MKHAPTPAEVDQHITNITLALTELARRFAIDLGELDGPAGNADPIR